MISFSGAAKLDPTIPSFRRLAGNLWRHLGLPRAVVDYQKYNQSWYDRNQEKQRAYARRYYRDNLLKCRADSNRVNLARREEKKSFVDALKTSTPCADCNQQFPSCCMDYDHLPGQEKITGLAVMVGNAKYKIADIEKEISKCELVCANCHRIRTWITRKNHARKPQTC